MSSLFLDALACREVPRPPVWLMRQAGRYMPSYQALRKKHSLWEMFHEPELAARVTRLPIDELGVDAAILFSDILVVAEMLGLQIHFPEGGGVFVSPQIRCQADLQNLEMCSAVDALGYVRETIALLKKDLSVPLIGFCGGPFTLATYLIEGGGKAEDLAKTKLWLYTDPQGFHELLDRITTASIDYLNMQIVAGVDAVQIFDSWAGLLPFQAFCEFPKRYLQKIVEAIQPSGVPIILFCRGSSVYMHELASLHPQAISLDWHCEMGAARKIVSPSIAVQGNLDPHLLLAPQPVIKKGIQTLLSSMHGSRGFIVNLGHGILPQTSQDNVRYLIDLVKS